MSGSLPPPRDGTQRYLKAIHDRLGDVLDRLPPPPQPAVDSGQVELHEPAAPAPVGGGVSSDPVEDTGGSGAKERRPTRASTPRKSRSTKPPVAEPAPAVKAPRAKPTPRRTAPTNPTIPKPTPKKGEDT